MDIVIDPQAIIEPFIKFFTQSPEIILGKVIFYFGWIPLAFVFLWGAKELWIFYRQNKWFEKNGKFTFLAIDIPRSNEQSPRAVENLFVYLAGAHGTLNLIDKYWDGKIQLGFSFEIVSIGGYTQFIIRTPIVFRDLVESAIYAQYPDAEVTEIDDYAAPYKEVRFPNDKYDLWGGEFILTDPYAFPIRTYKDFEHQFGEPETTFRDPMAALMDLCSTLKPGEQLWYQMLIIPTDMVWPADMEESVAKILKEKPPFKPNLLHQGADLALSGISQVGSAVFGPVEGGKKEEKKDDSLKMMNLKPKQKKQIEAIHEKSSKTPFKVKLRMVYLAEKEVMSKTKVVNGFVGYIKQFTATDLNGLKPDQDRTATTANYLFKEAHINRRKNRVFTNYVNRDAFAGRNPGMMNVEELATLWHFPIESVVKAPLIQKAPGRKAEPPMSLPKGEAFVSEEKAEPLFLGDFDEEIAPRREEKKEEIEPEIGLEEDAKGAPPENLPFV